MHEREINFESGSFFGKKDWRQYIRRSEKLWREDLEEKGFYAFSFGMKTTSWKFGMWRLPTHKLLEVRWICGWLWMCEIRSPKSQGHFPTEMKHFSICPFASSQWAFSFIDGIGCRIHLEIGLKRCHVAYLICTHGQKPSGLYRFVCNRNVSSWLQIQFCHFGTAKKNWTKGAIGSNLALISMEGDGHEPPSVEVYIPIIRIPYKRWMTISQITTTLTPKKLWPFSLWESFQELWAVEVMNQKKTTYPP